MSKKTENIALNEAGYDVANILVGTPFKYVTIKDDAEKDEFEQRSLGNIMYEKPRSKEKWEQHSILKPNEFEIFFKDDFAGLAGLVAESLYKGKISLKGSKGDLGQWIGISLNKLPESLSDKYLDFLLEYTIQVLN